MLELSPHNLQLKVESVIVMLCNINQLRFCNATRFAVKKLMKNFTKTTILKGKYKKQDVLTSHISIILKSLTVCHMNLKKPCFSNSELYFACSCNEKLWVLFLFTCQKIKQKCRVSRKHCDKWNGNVIENQSK